LTSPIAHKYFCLGKGQVENQEPPDSRNQTNAENGDRTGIGSENDDIGHGDNGRNTSGKAVYPINEVDGVGKSHNPEKGKENPDPDKHPEIIFKKDQISKYMTGEDNQKARSDLDKKFGSGIQSMKVIKNTTYQRNTQTYKYWNKPEVQLNFRLHKDKNQRNGDRHYRKTYTPQTRDISGMDLPFVSLVIPCIFMRQAEYQPYGYE
jgi:hypothetical protein